VQSKDPSRSKNIFTLWGILRLRPSDYAQDEENKKGDMQKTWYTYIMSNRHRTVYYVGITNDIARRSFEHERKLHPQSFTAKYNIDELLYVEMYEHPGEAIAREKQWKGWTRNKKMLIIKTINPEMRNLFELSEVEN